MQTGALLMMKKDTIHNHTRNTDAIGLFKQTQMSVHTYFLTKVKKRGGELSLASILLILSDKNIYFDMIF